MRVYIFEDNTVNNFLPIAYTRAVFELKAGIKNILEKNLSNLEGETDIVLIVREYLKDVVAQRYPDYEINPDTFEDGLWINGRMLFSKEDIKKALDSKNTVYMVHGTFAIGYLDGKTAGSMFKIADEIELKVGSVINTGEINPVVYNYFFEFPLRMAESIKEDFEKFYAKGEIKGKIYENVTILNKDKVFIAEDVIIKPGVVLDAEEGPIVIERGAKVMANAVIEGPCFVGEKATIKIGAKIYEGTHIGPVCKIGGEVDAAIFHGYSNKQHEGFIGHAYIGEWVNIGADTNNSDLKNNYSNVKVWVNGQFINSGSMFVGLTMGDHSKTGINTMFNTGTVVGVGCNIFGSGYPPKYIPSFAWGGANGFVEHRFDKMIETARAVMARRKKTLSDEEYNLLKYIFEKTKPERNW